MFVHQVQNLEIHSSANYIISRCKNKHAVLEKHVSFPFRTHSIINTSNDGDENYIAQGDGNSIFYPPGTIVNKSHSQVLDTEEILKQLKN